MIGVWRGPCWPDQVANAKDSTVNLTPVSQAPADAVKAAWDAVLLGQEIPMIGERIYVGEECDT